MAAQIGQACREHGFFYILGHGVDEGLQQRLLHVSRQFFAQALERKLEIRMGLGGRAWRGYFPVGGELTSGRPDLKEGLYFGAELDDDHPLVRAGTPMHGRNLFPSRIPLFRETVLDYMAAMTALGHRLMEGMALSLGLGASYFADRYTQDPLVLFRIFHYPRDTRRGRGRAVLGCRRAYRLRGPDHPETGRCGWLAGKVPVALDRRASHCRRLPVQHRGHAGSDDGWEVPLDATPGVESDRTRAALVSVLL